MNNISKEDFKQYLDLLATGKYDMYNYHTRMKTNLTHDEWKYIQDNEDELHKRFKKEGN